MHADLGVPPDARGIVLFAHGSGSSRKSPRNRSVAAALQEAHFATLMPRIRVLPIGYFGASTGAAAALVAAAQLKDAVHAIVSRGGRPDLAGHALDEVRAPTLLIVGGYDEPVFDFNRDALGRLRGVKALRIVPRAGHLFEEPGAMAHVIALARAWFDEHLTGHAAASGILGDRS